METVRLSVGEVGEENAIKISFRYHEDFVDEIRGTGIFRFRDVNDEKFWYAALSQEVIDAVLEMEFVPVREKEILQREKDMLLSSSSSWNFPSLSHEEGSWDFPSSWDLGAV
jgi:hypothetical protein